MFLMASQNSVFRVYSVFCWGILDLKLENKLENRVSIYV